ncbi:MAG: NAD(P)H-dependent oxidoreductase [Alphaproteobacteria bacterium]|jgi:NAD(P)H dehydrogenase (quinone)
MNVFIVHAHPEPASFNGAATQTAAAALADAGHAVAVSDLYAMGFDAVSGRNNFTSEWDPDYYKQQAEEMHASQTGGFAPDIEAELRKVEACDLMIWQFPLWWFGLPAILKGWVDRVFVMGRVYGQGRMYENGVFRGKRALLSLTTGGPAPVYGPEGRNGDIDAILRPIQRGMLQFTGFSVLAPHIVFGPAHLDEDERMAALMGWRARLAGVFEEGPIDPGRY